MRRLLAPPSAVVVAVLLMTGCASTLEGPMTRGQLMHHLAERGLTIEQIIIPFELTDEMKAWARETAPLNLPPETRLVKLQNRLLDKKEMDLEYVWGQTGTATEVFEQRKANCLSFTNLFVGMAREVGVPVDFLKVEDVQTYRKEGDLVVVSDHIAVGYDNPPETRIFDFSEFGLQEHQKIQRISDLTAIAMYYTNRGAEALQVGDLETSLEWLRTAVLLDPFLSHTWVNYGVGLRRTGDARGAEDCYHRAIEVDPDTPSAYQNLISLLRLEGREAEALEFEELIRRSHKNRNPFTYLTLGDLNRRRGRIEDARRLYRRAILLGCDDAECFAALGQLELTEGNSRAARKLLKKAQNHDPAEKRTMELEALLGPGSRE